MTSTDCFDYKSFIRNLTTRPGVYRMLDADGHLLYVGKARNLKRRVASYFRSNPDSAKTQLLAQKTRTMEITATHTENEALILESNLIKSLKPRYNVLLRDDKGYPYLHLSDDPWPRLSIFRGEKKSSGQYFGPYPNSHSLRDTLNLLQKTFRIRQCENSFFSHRTRPCLQYQIKRCSGPCTGLISPEHYQQDIDNTVRFLNGENHTIIDTLITRMEKASQALDYENAAIIRDQIGQLRRLQQRQHINSDGGDLDVVTLAIKDDTPCIQMLCFRAGQLLGHKNFFPRSPKEDSPESVLSAFLSQYYLNKPIPEEILLSHSPEDNQWLLDSFRERSGKTVTITTRPRDSQRRHWLAMAGQNAELALDNHLSSRADKQFRLELLQEQLQLEEIPQRLECFDISHSQGEAPVASCVVFNQEGPLNSHYRRYNIRDITLGDDYAAIEQAVRRRYQHLKREELPLPDLLFIDGGKGQMKRAILALESIQADIRVIGIAKGSDRKAGLETLYLSDQSQPTILSSNSSALHLIQQIRDEAHRFALAGHRRRRMKSRTTSTLEAIPGVGRKRRQLLLKQFGGLQLLARAGIEDLRQIPGVSQTLAQRIYEHFHGDQ